MAIRPPSARRGCNPFARLGHALRENQLSLIIYSLVLNTGLAQLFYNSAGVVLPNSDWRFRYLVFSAFLSMTAFSLFELHIVRQLKDLLSKEKSIRTQLPRWQIPGHVLTLAVISLYNVYSLALLNAAIWPDLHLVGIPEFAKPWKYYFHAVMYSLILFLAAVVGERKKTSAEVAAEKDEQLQTEMIEGSDDYYRELIRKGGRNVVVARQVLSSPEAAERQQQLLLALEGGSGGTLGTPVIATSEEPQPPMVLEFPADMESGTLGPIAAGPDDEPPDDDDLPPAVRYNGRRVTERLGGNW